MSPSGFPPKYLISEKSEFTNNYITCVHLLCAYVYISMHFHLGNILLIIISEQFETLVVIISGTIGASTRA